VGGDYGPYFQSERRDLYQKCAQQLLEGGHAYKCYCSAERLARMRAEKVGRKESMRSYDRHCRDLSLKEQTQFESGGISPVIRFKVPLIGQTTFHDLIRGDITFDNSELDDLVLMKSDGYPTYHLANIVDDHFMKITHVMRADEWLSSTPRHVLLYRAFDWEPPLFAHMPIILGPDKSKLSKRHGAVSLTEYSDMGYLPEAMMNFLALLGWALDDKTEIIDRDDLIKYFTIDRISKTGAIYSQEKLAWMNGVYVRRLRTDEMVDRVMPFLESGLPETVKRPISRDYVSQIVPLIQERVKVLGEVSDVAAFFFVEELDYDVALLLKRGMSREKATVALKMSKERLESCPFDASSLEGVLRTLSVELGLKTGDLFGLLRVVVTGRTAAPPLFQTMAVLGQEQCLRRIEAAQGRLKSV